MDTPSSESFIADVRQYDAFERCHSHSHHQIILPLNGTLELQIEDRSGTASALRGAIVPGDARHAFRGVGDNRFVVLDLAPHSSAASWPDGLGRLLEKPNFFPVDNGLYHYARLVGAELSRGTANPTLATRLGGLFVELLAHRLAIGSDKHIRSAQRLGPALEYIDAHLDRNIPVHRLAALSCLSVGRFHAAFRAYTGRPPGQYIAELRMQKASALLERTEWPVARVAATVGYVSQAAFTHAFKRQFGLSPARYRRRTR